MKPMSRALGKSTSESRSSHRCIPTGMNWYRTAQSWESSSASELEEYARMYESEGGGNAIEFEWVFNPYFPLVRFTEYGTSSDEWQSWFRQEVDMMEEEGVRPREYYEEMLDFPIQEPIVVEDAGDRLYVWDGYHRVGASFVANRATIPAVIGTPKS